VERDPGAAAAGEDGALVKAFVCLGDGKRALEERPKPVIAAPTDAIVRVTKTTICGSDLHILEGDVST
jgi:alcohol dehydrogenase